MRTTHQYDALIIGSGAAGLGLALSLADNMQVAIISKDSLHAGSSQHAQGGIAAVMSDEDSLDSHIEDTLEVGAGLCDRAVVEHTVKNARTAIEWLIDHGVPFTRAAKERFHLTQEGGHSHRRVIHAADRTGAAVVNTLIEQVLEHPNIQCFVEHTAIDLMTDNGTCIGISVLDNQTHQIQYFFAAHTVLATGGASSVYIHTSNPDFTSGDGIAMAWRAGARIKNMEFNQFHPTCLFHPEANSFLISEAVRGEGGKLITPDGERFMPKYDKRAELAPRDIVARAIDHELKDKNLEYVLLDITHLTASKIKHFFPTIYKECLKYQINITREPIPVVPAAHYTCGGVITDLSGKTDIAGLYAIGEVACTGLHGANRMASNSLLECLVFAASCGNAIKSANATTAAPQQPQPSIVPRMDSHHIEHEIINLRRLMWNHVGIVRNDHDLHHAFTQINLLRERIHQETTHDITRRIIELRNLIDASNLIVRSAMTRKESRGLHYNRDHPNLSDQAEDTIIVDSANEIATA